MTDIILASENSKKRADTFNLCEIYEIEAEIFLSPHIEIKF